MNFWISEVKQYEETMANEQSQSGGGGIISIKSPTEKAGVL